MGNEDRSKGQLAQALTLLDWVGQEFTAALGVQQVIERLLPAATEVTGAEGALVWLWDEAPERWLVCRTTYRRGQKCSPVNLRLRPGQGIAGWVAQQGESAIVLDAQDDPRFFVKVEGGAGCHTTSLLAVSLWARDRIMGVLEVVNKLSGDFDEDDLSLVKTLAASAALAMDNAQLVETLHQRTVDVQACSKKLDAFSHALTNDLRGPLGLIVSFAQVLEEDYATLSGEELHRYLHTIAQRGRNMVSVIDKLLVVRTEPAKEIEEEIGPLDTASIVAEARRRLADLIKENRAEIILPKSWPVALGHGPWVEEVWANYLSNAISYGGQPPRVELGAKEQGDGTVRFWVRDNGPGLGPEERVRLFIPVTQREQVHDVGYGLGLAVARRIVEKLGGQVGVESEVGQGSVFFFTLPVAE
jgi:signal transduction histidine kinase